MATLLSARRCRRTASRVTTGCGIRSCGCSARGRWSTANDGSSSSLRKTWRRRKVPRRGAAAPAPRDRLGPRGPRDPLSRHGGDAIPNQVPRVRGSSEESAQHDRVRRDRDPRVPMRTVQVLDRPPTPRANPLCFHEAVVMRVRWEGGILVQDALKEVILDPARKTPGSVVSHGHMDHLTSGGIMTPQTVEVLKVRRGGTGQPLPYGKEIELNGFRVVLKDAGHVFGSAMVRVDDLLYTGDFNPEGGATWGKAHPEVVRELIGDAKYGRPGYNFPPKHDVEADLLTWLEMELAQGPVALGGYEFGKSQELIALVNRLGVEVAVADKIADLADLYGRYGIKLRYRRLSTLEESERKDPRAYVLPPGWLRPPLDDSVSWLGSIGLKTAYVSGWCAVFDYTGRYRLGAPFPPSDHRDFEDGVTFIEACRPRKVYTAFSGAKNLAKAVERRLKIRAEALLTR